MTATGRCLVMGAAIGYSEAQIAPFVESLRRTGYTGDIVLIVEPALVARARGTPLFSGVELLGARQWWPVRHRLFWGRRRWALKALWQPMQRALWMLLRALPRLPLGDARCARWRHAVALRLFPPTETRYLRFLDYLQGSDHQRILFSDVRDVVFQQDPFAHLPCSGLAVSIEVPAHTVGTQPHNAQWVRQGFGDDMLERIGAQPVSCSGVTYGDRASMLRYLALMVDAIYALGPAAAGSSGIDQGIHNVLVWTGQAGPVQHLETLGSAVATLGGVDEADLRRDAAGQLLNRDGSVISVLHQYDRLPGLRAPILERLTGRSPPA